MKINRWQIIGILKMSLLGLVLVVAVLAVVTFRRNAQIKEAEPIMGFEILINQKADGAILTIPYQQTLYKHFGNAINPQITLLVKTITGYQEMEFLVDSGAVVSALPKTTAEELGVDLTSLPRITIEGFAGQKTFAYKGEFIVKIGSQEETIPVVFSENPQANNILGRIGFFDKFNVEFNAKSQQIVISHK